MNCSFQVSTACSIGILGTQLGLALGFQVPTLLVKNDDDYTIIAAGLMKLSWTVVVFMIPVVAALIFCKYHTSNMKTTMLKLNYYKIYTILYSFLDNSHVLFI